MVNELKLPVVHFTYQNPMQICSCAWIYCWTKNYGKSGLGCWAVVGGRLLGRRGPWAADRWAFRPLGRWAIEGSGPVFSKTLIFSTNEFLFYLALSFPGFASWPMYVVHLCHSSSVLQCWLLL